MATYTKRIQTVLTAEQYQALTELADKQGRPLSLLVREAIEKVYFEQAALERRQAALARLLALQAPVSDWEQMEEEIVRGANA
ncbi:MAG: hypothetical protein HYU88_01800 [Chloroflexi bacterium]|nr:hypothetical protein [Chloroflexota bacterium]MBI4507860.1 hypothetical protein [Chloroflexota bacterium]